MLKFEVERLLEEKGIRPTANRILVARELMGATRPVSLAELEEMLGMTMSKASIFRVLELFAEHDVVHEIEDGSRSVKYELCHGGDAHSIYDEHVHFYCEKCGQTYCFEGVKVPQVDMPAGFLPHSINYMVKGVCPNCGK